MGVIDKAGKRFARGLSHPINASATVIMALYTFLWGLWLATPAWTTFTQAPLYSRMADAAPEWLWGSIAMAVGVLMIYGVLKPSYASLSKAAYVGAIHWAIISGFYFWGDYQNTGGLTSGMICTYCVFVYLNLRVNRNQVSYEDQ